MIKLGNKVNDTITGFNGIATGRTMWLYGCARILIEPDTLDKDGKPVEAVWFDEQRVETLKKQKPPISEESSAMIGGPQHDCAVKSDPRK